MSDQTITAYDKRAHYYETKWKDYLDHTHKEFLRRIDTNENDILLDVSGGTGLLAKILIDNSLPFKQYIINDPSTQMLATAKDRHSENERISYTNYRAEQLHFDTNQFDRIFCLNSFHFFSSQQQVLDQFYKLLKPGGHLYILDWNRTGFFVAVNQLLKCLTSDYIDTRSLQELNTMLSEGKFKTINTSKWNWRYWKFFFIDAVKRNE